MGGSGTLPDDDNLDELASAPATWNVTSPTDDASIVRRRRALAPIQVLTDIERNKSQYDGEFWRNYDLFNIALAVIDQVALAMGISAGRTWDETVDYAATQATRQVPTAGRGEWMAVAERVVVSLVTTDVETVPYLVHTEEGPQWRAQRFRLLYMHSGGGEDGQEYLRASEQAINIFVEALDLDIEAAQIANEAQLSALIARGCCRVGGANRPASAIPVDPISGAGPSHRRRHPHRPRHPRLGGRRAGVVEFCTRPRAGPARSRSRAARRGR